MGLSALLRSAAKVLALAYALRIAYPVTVCADPQPSTNLRYSELHEIDRDSVQHLRLAFSFRSGVRGSQAGAPIVIGTTLFWLTPFPHTLFALDLAGTPGAVKWRLTPESEAMAVGLQCCERADQGPSYADGRLFFSTLDGRVVAVDPGSGHVLWSVPVADVASGESLTSAPAIAGGYVLIGNSGDDFGVRGWIAELDAHTGRQVWKRYSTGPDVDVGIGSDFSPVDARDRGTDRGTSSWSSAGWQHGGGAVSASALYDPELSLVLYGTGRPAPWNPEQRFGDNRWTSGIFARDPQSGAARWFTALHTHDLYSWGADGANLALDRMWAGRPRPLLIHPDADGRIYVLDRGSGEILAADPFISPIEARPETDPERIPHAHHQVRDLCPAWVGAVGGGSAISRQTGLLYVPVSRLCMDLEPTHASYLQGTEFLGANIRVRAMRGQPRGALIGWDLGARKVAWRAEENFPVASDVLVTAGGLVFYGTLEGSFKAVDAMTGRLLWQFKTSAGITGQPTTYVGPDGHQYIAVAAGVGPPYGLAREDWIDRRDATAARGLAQALRDLPRPADPSGRLYVFRLP